MKQQQHEKAALYCRLSVDDGSLGGSVSIETQRILLEQYCKDHAITNFEFYCDDGASGTNFQRKSFQKMHDDILSGEITLVLVKDLSRFGRNYIEVGAYVEEFKEHGVRFIAVDDNYDSAVNVDDLMFPMKNVINELYARDVSKKTKAAKKAKARSGQFMGSKPPFGYKLDPNDRHHLIVDEPAAEVIRRIFRLAAQGHGYNKIACILRDEKVLTPIAYFNLHNPDYFKSDYWRKEFDWHVTSIRAMLNNEVYLGKLIYGKQRSKKMKSKLKVKVPKEEWIIVEHAHEAIIDQSLWDTVHRMMDSRRRPTKTGEVQMFAGLLRCADCGNVLTFSQHKRPNGYVYGSYSCQRRKTHGKGYCSYHHISYKAITEIVLMDIRRVLAQYQMDEQQFRRSLESQHERMSFREAETIRQTYAQKEKRCSDLDMIIGKLYEDNALGKISDSRYEALSQTYEAEQKALKQELPELRVKLQKLQEQSSASDRFIDIIRKYSDIHALDAGILNELIDRILVHEKEVLPDGSEVREIEIYYRLVGKISKVQRKVA